MRVISQKKLRAFWSVHPKAEEPLKAWYKTTEKAEWKQFADVRATYSKVDRVGSCYVFNIHGNHYRLIAKISHDWTVVLVLAVLTHKQYDTDDWKTSCRCEE